MRYPLVWWSFALKRDQANQLQLVTADLVIIEATIIAVRTEAAVNSHYYLGMHWAAVIVKIAIIADLEAAIVKRIITASAIASQHQLADNLTTIATAITTATAIVRIAIAEVDFRAPFTANLSE